LAQTLAGSAALVLAVRLAPVRRRVQIAVFCVVGAAIAVAVADLLFTFKSNAGGVALPVNRPPVALGPPLVFLAVRQHTRVSLRTVLGAVTIYVLVGLFFAFDMIKAGRASLRDNPAPRRPDARRLRRALKGQLYWPF